MVVVVGKWVVSGNLELSLEGDIEAHHWWESGRRVITYLGKVKLVVVAVISKRWGGKVEAGGFYICAAKEFGTYWSDICAMGELEVGDYHNQIHILGRFFGGGIGWKEVRLGLRRLWRGFNIIVEARNNKWWEDSLGENGYMYMYGWVPSWFPWNYQNIVNQLYPNTK